MRKGKLLVVYVDYTLPKYSKTSLHEVPTVQSGGVSNPISQGKEVRPQAEPKAQARQPIGSNSASQNGPEDKSGPKEDVPRGEGEGMQVEPLPVPREELVEIPFVTTLLIKKEEAKFRTLMLITEKQGVEILWKLDLKSLKEPDSIEEIATEYGLLRVAYLKSSNSIMVSKIKSSTIFDYDFQIKFIQKLVELEEERISKEPCLQLGTQFFTQLNSAYPFREGAAELECSEEICYQEAVEEEKSLSDSEPQEGEEDAAEEMGEEMDTKEVKEPAELSKNQRKKLRKKEKEKLKSLEEKPVSNNPFDEPEPDQQQPDEEKKLAEVSTNPFETPEVEPVAARQEPIEPGEGKKKKKKNKKGKNKGPQIEESKPEDEGGKSGLVNEIVEEQEDYFKDHVELRTFDLIKALWDTRLYSSTSLQLLEKALELKEEIFKGKWFYYRNNQQDSRFATADELEYWEKEEYTEEDKKNAFNHIIEDHFDFLRKEKKILSDKAYEEGQKGEDVAGTLEDSRELDLNGKYGLSALKRLVDRFQPEDIIFMLKWRKNGFYYFLHDLVIGLDAQDLRNSSNLRVFECVSEGKETTFCLPTESLRYFCETILRETKHFILFFTRTMQHLFRKDEQTNPENLKIIHLLNSEILRRKPKEFHHFFELDIKQENVREETRKTKLEFYEKLIVVFSREGLNSGKLILSTMAAFRQSENPKVAKDLFMFMVYHEEAKYLLSAQCLSHVIENDWCKSNKQIIAVFMELGMRNNPEIIKLVTAALLNEKLPLSIFIEELSQYEEFKGNRPETLFKSILSQPLVQLLLFELYRLKDENQTRIPQRNVEVLRSSSNQFVKILACIQERLIGRMLNNDLQMRLLHTDEYYKDSVVNFLQQVTPTANLQDSLNRRRTEIHELYQKVKAGLRRLEEANYILEPYQFYLRWVEDLVQIQDEKDFMMQTLKAARENGAILQLDALLDEKNWERMRTVAQFEPTWEEFKLLSTGCDNMNDLAHFFTEYYDRFNKTLKDMAAGNFTMEQNQKYFWGTKDPKFENEYRDIIERFKVSNSGINTIITYSKQFYALFQILELNQSIEELRAMEFLNISDSKEAADRRALFNKFQGKRGITMTELLRADTTGLTLKRVYLGIPPFIKQLSKCPKTLKLIQETQPETIHMMRGECNDDDAETLFLLSTLNSCVGEFTKSASNQKQLSIDQVVAIIESADKKNISKLDGQIEGVEKINSHIVEIFKRTLKGTENSGENVKAILKNSTIIISYSLVEEVYTSSCKYKKGGEYLSYNVYEFSELRNRVKTMATKDKDQDSMDTESIEYSYRRFKEMCDSLDELIKELTELKIMGLIDTEFSGQLVSTLQSFAGGMNIFKRDEQMGGETSESSLHVNMTVDSCEILIQVNQRLEALISEMRHQLIKGYSDPESYFLTYFHGVKLYHLAMYLKDGANELTKTEILSVLLESINSEGFAKERKSLASEMKDYKGVLDSISSVAREWTKLVYGNQDFRICPFNDSSIFLPNSRVKLCSIPSLRELKSANTNDLVNSPFFITLKLLTESKQTMLKLSQVLFCRKNMREYEIQAFLYRCFNDRNHQFYFMYNLDALDPELIKMLRNEVQEVLSQQKKFNTNLLVFLENSEYNKLLKESEYFQSVHEQIKGLKVEMKTVYSTFSSLMESNQIVMSAKSGMGKTTHISSRCSNLCDIFLAGELNPTTLVNRFQNVLETNLLKRNFSIHLKLDTIEEFSFVSSLVDYTLFEICFLRRLTTSRGCVVLSPSILEKVFIEISNTFVSELVGNLTVLKILIYNDKNIESKSLTHIDDFDIRKVNYCEDALSPEQIAAKFLHLIKKKELNERSVYYIDPIPKDYFYRLFEERFLDHIAPGEQRRASASFAKFQLWVKTIHRLVIDMENIESLSIREKMQQVKKSSLRTEIGEEILIYASKVIQLAADHAITSQEETIALMKETSAEARSRRTEQFKNRISKIQKWDCSDIIIPLFNDKRFLLAMQTKTILTEKPNPIEAGKKIDRVNMRTKIVETINQMKWYDDCPGGIKIKEPEMLIRVLADFAGTDPSQLSKDIQSFHENQGFNLTKSNFMKIALIISKAKQKVPIIIMGESGCGKTYISKFVSEVLLKENMEAKTLYSGVTEFELNEFMTNAIAKAKEEEPKNKNLWIFFDEFNTTSLQPIICEMMLDRVYSIGKKSLRKIPDNVIFIGCCNPYSINVHQDNKVGLAPQRNEQMLSHRVYPLPERIISYVWDFGQLSKEDELKNVKGIIKAEKLFVKDDEQTNYAGFILSSHMFIREKEGRSSVSMRDIRRALRVFVWFREKFWIISETSDLNSGKKDAGKAIDQKSMICSLMLCYGARLNGQEKTQKEFVEKLIKALTVEHITMFKPPSVAEVSSHILKLAEDYFRELNNKKIFTIPENIAINHPLKENFIAMLCAFETKTPLIICGSPGTSKTLTMQIMQSVLMNKERLNSSLFRGSKDMLSLYFGGSNTSKADGIRSIYQRGRKFIEKNLGSDTPTVIFDEIGLAELSPYNPLKILHPLLEDPKREIAFLGMSNWTLDLSKMNRLLYVARPDLTREDLKQIFKKSIENFKKIDTSMNKDILGKELEEYFDILADTYFVFREWQHKHALHRDFHGSRDMYSLSKFIYQRVQDRIPQTKGDIEQMIRDGIDRNLNGECYTFCVKKPERDVYKINQKSIVGLDNEPKQERKLNISLRDFERTKSIDGILKNKTDDGDKYTDRMYTSAGVFKMLFEIELEKKGKQLDARVEFYREKNLLELIKDNIRDTSARFLLLRSEGELVDRMILEQLRETYSKEPVYEGKIVDWRGVSSLEKTVDLMATMKTYITLGYVVIMKNLDDLYASLYDLFNQKYVEMSGQKMCYLYYGEFKQRIQVHPNFKCIVIVGADEEMTRADLETNQPAPFLNRFEKYFLRVSNVLSHHSLQRLLNLKKKAIELTEGSARMALSITTDLISSLCLTDDILDTAEEAKASEMKVEDEEDIPDSSFEKLMQMTTSNFLLKNEFPMKQRRKFKIAHKYTDIGMVLQDLRSKPGFKMCLFTFSSAMVSGLDELLKGGQLRVLEGSLLSEAGVEGRRNILKDNESPHLVIHLSRKEEVNKQLEMISQMKGVLNQCQAVQGVLVLIHLPNDLMATRALQRNVGIDFWNGWDNRVIDNLMGTDYAELQEVVQATLKDIVLNNDSVIGQRIFKRTVVEVLKKLVQDSRDVSLEKNIEAIERMLMGPEGQPIMELIRDKLPTQDQIMEMKNKDILNSMKIGKRKWVDIEEKLYEVYRETNKMIIEPYLKTVNAELGNFASFACSKEEFKEVMQEELERRLQNCNFEKKSNHSLTHVKLPFLSSVYPPIREAMKMKIKLNKDLLREIKEKEEECLKTGKAQLKDMFEKIENAQKRLFQEEWVFETECQDIYAVLQEKDLENLVKDSETVWLIIYDLLSEQMQSQKELRILQENEAFGVFVELCEYCSKMLPGSGVQRISRPLNIALYFLTNYTKELLIIIGLFDSSQSSLKQMFDKYQETVEGNDASFRFERLNFILTKVQSGAVPDLTDIKNDGVIDSKEVEKHLNNLTSVIQVTASSTGFGAADQKEERYIRYLILVLRIYSEQSAEQKRMMANHWAVIKRDKAQFDANIFYSSAKDLIFHHLKLLAANMDHKQQARLLPLFVEFFTLRAKDSFFDLFFKDWPDAFNRLSHVNQELICNSIISPILESNRRVLRKIIELDDYSRIVLLVEENESLKGLIDCGNKNIDLRAQRQSSRNMSFLIIFIEKLTVVFQDIFKQMKEEYQETPVQESSLLERVMSWLALSESRVSFETIVVLAILRSLLDSNYFKEYKPHKGTNLIDEFFPACPDLEKLLGDVKNYTLIYWIQSIISVEGTVTQKFRDQCKIAGKLIFRLESKSKESNGITFFNAEIVKKSNSISEQIDNLILGDRTQELEDLFRGTDQKQTEYIVAIILINKFIKITEKDDVIETSELEFIKFYKETFGRIRLREELKDLYTNIIGMEIMKKIEYTEKAIGSKKEYFTKLVQTIYQFRAGVVCFGDSLDYRLNTRWAGPNANIEMNNLKSGVIGGVRMFSHCKILTEVMRNREKESMYSYAKDLGMYRCSCGMAYNLGDCGMASVRYACSNCRLPIGGQGHVMVARENHIKIATYAEMDQLIAREFEAQRNLYFAHQYFTPGSSDLEISMIPHILQEDRLQRVLDSRYDTVYTQRHLTKRILLHFYDHLYILTSCLFEKTTQANSQLIERHIKIDSSLKLSRAGEVKSPNEYLQSHLLNDVMTLTALLRLNTDINAMDWVNACLSESLSRLQVSPNRATEPRLVLTPAMAHVNTPNSLLNEQEEFKQLQKKEETMGPAQILKCVLYKKIGYQAIPGMFEQYSPDVKLLFQIMRHNDTEKQHIFSQFVETVKKSEYTLLKKLVTAKEVMDDFHAMVEANLRIVQHVHTVCHRSYTFEEACNTTIQDLKGQGGRPTVRAVPDHVDREDPAARAEQPRGVLIRLPVPAGPQGGRVHHGDAAGPQRSQADQVHVHRPQRGLLRQTAHLHESHYADLHPEIPQPNREGHHEDPEDPRRVAPVPQHQALQGNGLHHQLPVRRHRHEQLLLLHRVSEGHHYHLRL
jgi:hypothetical protein